MQGRVEDFLAQKLSDPPPPADQKDRAYFDALICSRYVIQRVFDIGWDPTGIDQSPNEGYDDRRTKVERLSKKYQWIALYEFLGYLSDHFYFRRFDEPPAVLRSASQLVGSGLLDPFVVEPLRVYENRSWDLVRAPALWWQGNYDPFPRPLSSKEQAEFANGIAVIHPQRFLALSDGEKPWLTLSAFHEWAEQRPVWETSSSVAHVDIEVALQSYVVSPDRAAVLLKQLSQREVGRYSHHWFDEPEFAQPLATLRAFPFQHQKLASRCELDSYYDTENWVTGAFSTTCRCARNEEQENHPSGSMPSPQLARMGNLSWLGRGFDFAPINVIDPVVRHVGKGFFGACIVRRDAIQEWLKHSGQWLVWRCYIRKFLHHNFSSATHMRAFWSTHFIKPDGELRDSDGGTCTFPHGPAPPQPLPWATLTQAAQ